MNIIFVSMMKDLGGSGFSTQIMTDNIIRGWKDGGHQVHFVAVVDSNDNSDGIRDDYRNRIDQLTIIRSMTNTTVHANKYVQFFFTMIAYLNTWIYRTVSRGIEVDDHTILVSHTPTLESAYICREIKKLHPQLTYIQYWSDPYCLSGKTSCGNNLKNKLQKMMEGKILSWADDIVYGTPLLACMQKHLFPKYSGRIRSVDVSYKPKQPGQITEKKAHGRPLVGYIGDYDSYVRNIEPSYNVFGQEECADFIIIGRGSQKLESKGNLTVYDRMSPNEVAKIEEALDVHVCLLNRSGFQIPGKIFYHTDTDKVILIVLDGLFADEIREYLQGFKRFEFCDNTEDSIRNAIHSFCIGKIKANLSGVGKLSPENVSADILFLEGIKSET